jgi:serine/threonine protein kinase
MKSRSSSKRDGREKEGRDKEGREKEGREGREKEGREGREKKERSEKRAISICNYRIVDPILNTDLYRTHDVEYYAVERERSKNKDTFIFCSSRYFNYIAISSSLLNPFLLYAKENERPYTSLSCGFSKKRSGGYHIYLNDTEYGIVIENEYEDLSNYSMRIDLSREQIYSIMYDSLAGLEALHSSGFTYVGLMLNSLFISRSGSTKIGAFNNCILNPFRIIERVIGKDAESYSIYTPIELSTTKFYYGQSPAVSKNRYEITDKKLTSKEGNIYSLGICFLLLLYPDINRILVSEKLYTRKGIQNFIQNKKRELREDTSQTKTKQRKGKDEIEIECSALDLIYLMTDVWVNRPSAKEALYDPFFYNISASQKDRDVECETYEYKRNYKRVSKFNLNSDTLLTKENELNPNVVNLAFSYFMTVSREIYKKYGPEAYDKGKKESKESKEKSKERSRETLQHACASIAMDLLYSQNVFGRDDILYRELSPEAIKCKLEIVEENAALDLLSNSLLRTPPPRIMNVLERSQENPSLYKKELNNPFPYGILDDIEDKQYIKIASYSDNQYGMNYVKFSPAYVFDSILFELKELALQGEEINSHEFHRLRNSLEFILSRTDTIPSLPYFIWHDSRNRIKRVAEVIPELIIYSIEEIGKYRRIKDTIYALARCGYYEFANKLNQVTDSAYRVNLILGLFRYGSYEAYQLGVSLLSKRENTTDLIDMYCKLISSGNLQAVKEFESLVNDRFKVDILDYVINLDKYTRAIIKSQQKPLIKERIEFLGGSLEGYFSKSISKLSFLTSDRSYLFYLEEIEIGALFQYSLGDILLDKEYRNVKIVGDTKEIVKGLLNFERVGGKNGVKNGVKKNYENYHLLCDLVLSVFDSNSEDINSLVNVDTSNFYQIFFKLPYSNSVFHSSVDKYCVQKALNYGIV